MVAALAAQTAALSLLLQSREGADPLLDLGSGSGGSTGVRGAAASERMQLRRNREPGYYNRRVRWNMITALSP